MCVCVCASGADKAAGVQGAEEAAELDAEKQAAAAVRSAERACSNSLEFLQGTDIVVDQVRHSVLQKQGGAADEAEAADVAEAIVAYCREQSISLCVMGSHGNGVVGPVEAPPGCAIPAGLGTVTDLVLSKLACATCVVRPETWPTQQQQSQAQSSTFPPA